MDKEAAAKLREQFRPHLKDFLRNGNVDFYPPALTVCPHCGGQAGLNEDGTWLCPKLTGCGAGGDVVDYAMENLRMPEHEAIRFLCRMFGIRITELDYVTSDEVMDNGLEEQLIGFLSTHPQVGVVIIDTLQKIRELGSEKAGYAGDYNAMTRLKGIADRFGVTLLAIHHTRKAKSNDPFQMVSGTTGLMGCADNTFVMLKDNRAENRTKLFGTGRDIRDKEFSLCFQKSPMDWVLEDCTVGSFRPSSHLYPGKTDLGGNGDGACRSPDSPGCGVRRKAQRTGPDSERQRQPAGRALRLSVQRKARRQHEAPPAHSRGSGIDLTHVRYVRYVRYCTHWMKYRTERT